MSRLSRPVARARIAAIPVLTGMSRPTLASARARTAALPILAGVLAALIAACAPSSAYPRPLGWLPTPASSARPSLTVIVNCRGAHQVRPASFLLACADGNAYLSGLRWSTWGTSPRATGTWRINDCTPICATGTFHSFPARVTLSRPEPLPDHRRTRYFTRITVALPAARCDTVAGHRTCYPASYTGDLWSTITHGLPAPATPQPGPTTA